MAPLFHQCTHLPPASLPRCLLVVTQDDVGAGRDCGVASFDLHWTTFVKPGWCLCPCAACWLHGAARLTPFVSVTQDHAQVQAIACLVIAHTVLLAGIHSSITGVLKGRSYPLAFRMPVSLMLDRCGDIDAGWFGRLELCLTVWSGGPAWFACALWLPGVPSGRVQIARQSILQHSSITCILTTPQPPLQPHLLQQLVVSSRILAGSR